MEFSRQEYWSGLPFPSPGDLPNPGMEPGSPALQADALSSEPPGNPNKHLRNIPGEKQCCQKTMHSVMSDSLWPHGLQPARLLCLWNFPGKNTGVGCHFLLQNCQKRSLQSSYMVGSQVWQRHARRSRFIKVQDERLRAEFLSSNLNWQVVWLWAH